MRKTTILSIIFAATLAGIGLTASTSIAAANSYVVGSVPTPDVCGQFDPSDYSSDVLAGEVQRYFSSAVIIDPKEGIADRTGCFHAEVYNNATKSWEQKDFYYCEILPGDEHLLDEEPGWTCVFQVLYNPWGAQSNVADVSAVSNDSPCVVDPKPTCPQQADISTDFDFANASGTYDITPQDDGTWIAKKNGNLIGHFRQDACQNGNGRAGIGGYCYDNGIIP